MIFISFLCQGSKYSTLILDWDVELETRTGVRDYLRCVSLRFILHGLFLMVAISFFFSSTSSISRAISPSDMDSSSSSELELESEELEQNRQEETGTERGGGELDRDNFVFWKLLAKLSKHM